MSTSTDEQFWQRQEKRREKRMGQPCCTQSGISWSMIDMPGKFAVVVHGEKDCLNCFHHHQGISTVRFYSTRLSDAQLTMGETEEPLRRCLELILDTEKPELILVLGTCPVEVVGADFLSTVELVANSTSTPIIGLRTSGLKLSSQQQMFDWLYATLAALPAIPRTMQSNEQQLRKLRILWRRKFNLDLPANNDNREHTLNLIGFPLEPLAEFNWVLEYLGLQVQSFPAAAGLADWRQLQFSDHSFVVDTAMFPKLMSVLDGAGQPYSEIPLPYGLDNTLTALRHICAIHNRLPELEQMCQNLLPLLEAQRQIVRDVFSSKTMGLVIRMRNSNQIQAVSYHGLGLYQAFHELGLTITILIQGPNEAKIQRGYQQILTDLEIEADFDVFTSPFQLGKHLKSQPVDFLCIADQGIEAARHANIPCIQPNQFKMGFSGARSNWQQLMRLFGESL